MAQHKKPPRLKDIMIKPPYPGKHIPITSILGEEVVVTAFTYIPSQFQNRLDYLAVQIKDGRKGRWFTTSSSFILDYFERVAQESLPCRVTFVLEKDAKGGRTYNVK
jgi:hypothetical protein